MIQIRPVSDLRNNFAELEKEVKNGQPIYLTKNGYGTMVLLSIEEYSKLTDQVEQKLDEADLQAESMDIRLSHEEIFEDLRKKINE
ncbi:MAG: type II toxin-antitoxin system prevent-host-death family antitoxin [Clostridia bacterium]|nr:type II toxin-antitoxin system prevent-host-death family antitoxin [Clostridia bacterium]